MTAQEPSRFTWQPDDIIWEDEAPGHAGQHPALTVAAQLAVPGTVSAQFIDLVGPKGYEHGWIFVGVPGIGARVFHPHHGHGRVSKVEGDHVGVTFTSPQYKSFGQEKLFRRREGEGLPRLEPAAGEHKHTGTWDKSGAAAARVRSLGPARPAALTHGTAPGFYASTLNPAYTYTETQHQAIRSYTGQAYTAINQRLRSGEGEKDTPRIKAIKSAFQPLPADMTLTRTIPANNTFLAGVIPGDVIADHGLSSTTVIPGSFGGTTGSTVMHILAPAGTPTIWAHPVSQHQNEHEMILAPGQPLAVISAKHDNKTAATHIYMLAVPPAGTPGTVSGQAAGTGA